MPLRELALLLLVTAGALTDVRTGKIPNALTYPAVVFGLALGLAGSGWLGFADSLWGLALAFVPFFGLFLAGGMGGGDVKMMAAVGALMGLEFTVQAMIHAVLVGGLIALLIVVWEERIWDTLRFLGKVLRRLLRPADPRPRLEVETQVPFGVAICLASFLTLLASWQGTRSPWHLLVAWVDGGSG